MLNQRVPVYPIAAEDVKEGDWLLLWGLKDILIVEKVRLAKQTILVMGTFYRSGNRYQRRYFKHHDVDRLVDMRQR